MNCLITTCVDAVTIAPLICLQTKICSNNFIFNINECNKDSSKMRVIYCNIKGCECMNASEHKALNLANHIQCTAKGDDRYDREGKQTNVKQTYLYMTIMAVLLYCYCCCRCCCFFYCCYCYGNASHDTVR